ncbi:MAG: serine/threonine-protein kinase, partial [Thermoanaerobaculia bacterium]|nr:serine/threonine-protein kinase [Thermoanaerobaculia bacterium]
MPLDAGSKLGSYEVVSALGAGGMGEVYRARDPKLGRDVAIKLLPEGLAADPDRLARSQREARLLASLQHPNIGAIFGMEEDGERRFLVLELIEGETLADRLRQDPLALDDALEIARQMAEAIEAAHERGIVHRDLKPANILVRTADPAASSAGSSATNALDQPKVLDFGVARALDPELDVTT